MIIYYLLIFIFGLIVGSFLNCVIYRLEKKESFLHGRSFCPNCKHSLAWYDLIPLLSFILLRRKCRYCHKSISWQYPIIETATGALFLLIFNFSAQGGQAIFNEISIFNSSAMSSLPNGFQFLNFVYYLLIACFLIVIFVYDLKHFIILDKVLIPAIAISLIYRLVGALFLNNQLSIINYLLSAFGAAGFFLLIYLISKGKWLGFADVKLVILLAMILGWPKIALSLFLSFFIGAIIGIGLIVFSGKKLKSEVPFAPFLITGTLIALFWGQHLIDWYSALIF
ncbi:prepilin peptidase [Patescibacteria group bacterium]|nr:prepilin peptidase [Patescibacteria group bacterium]